MMLLIILAIQEARNIERIAGTGRLGIFFDLRLGGSPRYIGDPLEQGTAFACDTRSARCWLGIGDP